MFTVKGHVHAAAGLQDLAKDDLIELTAQGRRHGGLGDRKGEFGGAEILESAAKAANGRTTGGDEVNGIHGRRAGWAATRG
jgi:hypothetical protein